VTVRNGSYPSFDSTLENEIPSNCNVLKTRTIEPFTLFNILQGKKGKQMQVAMADLKGEKTKFKKIANLIRANLFIPDARKGWNYFAYREASKFLKNNAADVIITSGPPHSTHLVGLKLQKKFNIKWLADFRDPWTEISYNSLLMRSNRSIRKDKMLETQVLEKASQVLVVSEEMKRSFANRCNQINVLHNGYDESDFEEQNNPQNPQFTITYTGNFKNNQNINLWWECLKKMNLLKKNIVFQIIGNIAPLIEESIEQKDISMVVQKVSFVPHLEAIKFMQQADLLFLPIPKVENNLGILTGKIFEYLASKTPILAMGPENGDASKILSKLHREPMIGYNDRQKLEKTLNDHYDKWYNNTDTKIKSNLHNTFNRKNLTLKLIDIING
tara:strand:+ start:30851 stop:32011 length:1161 start_codon:yes stop_codon:yes gene_type:complete